MKNINKKTKDPVDPVKYRALINQFRKEWVIPTEKKAIQIIDSAQNFSIYLDKKGYKTTKTN